MSKSMIYISENEFVIHGIHFGLNENKLIIEIHFLPYLEKNVTRMVIYSSVWFEFPWLLRSFIPYFEYNCIHEYDNWNGIIRGFPFSTELYEPDYNNFCIFIQYGFEEISISLVFDSFESVLDLEKAHVSQNGPHFHGLNEKKYSNTKKLSDEFFCIRF